MLKINSNSILVNKKEMVKASPDNVKIVLNEIKNAENTYWGSYGQFGINIDANVNFIDKKTGIIIKENVDINFNWETNYLGDDDDELFTDFMNEEEEKKFEELNDEDADYDEYEQFMEKIREKYDDEYKQYVADLLVEGYCETYYEENVGEVINEWLEEKWVEEDIDYIIENALENEYYVVDETEKKILGTFDEWDGEDVYDVNHEEEVKRVMLDDGEYFFYDECENAYVINENETNIFRKKFNKNDDSNFMMSNYDVEDIYYLEKVAC